METENILLELPLTVKTIGNEFLVDDQAYNGLVNWLNNFASVTLCALEDPNDADCASVKWTSISDLIEKRNLTVHVLPWGYGPIRHFKHVGQVKQALQNLIPEHRYLCFSDIGWFGAWGTVAAGLAKKTGQRYSVYLDWVVHEFPVSPNQSKTILHKLVFGFIAFRTKQLSLWAVKNAALGLFHGKTVYDAYAPYCKESHVVHNIHLKKKDIIPRDEHEARLGQDHKTVNVCYLGRVHPMKEPLDWIHAIEKTVPRLEEGTKIKATWYGEGPLLEETREVVLKNGLADVIRFPGAEKDRATLLAFLRTQDIFLFCHSTPESPRCLIESLMSGVPIIGYTSSYARDLIAEHGGGALCEIGDIEGLSELLYEHITNKTALNELARSALRSGENFSDEAVFKHRSDLIKGYS